MGVSEEQVKQEEAEQKEKALATQLAREMLEYQKEQLKRRILAMQAQLAELEKFPPEQLAEEALETFEKEKKGKQGEQQKTS